MQRLALVILLPLPGGVLLPGSGLLSRAHLLLGQLLHRLLSENHVRFEHDDGFAIVAVPVPPMGGTVEW